MTTTTLGTTSARTTHVPAVRLGGVNKYFGDVHAVRGLNLEIQPGEIVAFLGPNGAGKTTTIDMVLGLSRPTAGDVEVFGIRPRTAIARGLVSAVMQSGGLLKDLTVEETVRLTASLFADTEDVDEALTGPDHRIPTVWSASVPAVSSSGCGSRWPCSPTPRC